MGFEPVTLRHGEDIAPVEPTRRGEVDVFYAGVWKTQFCSAQTIGKPFIRTRACFTFQHESQPFVAVQRRIWILFSQVAPGAGHARQTEGIELFKGWMCQHVHCPCWGYW